MSVTVRQQNSSSTTHKKGEGMSVTDGHLLILDGRTRVANVIAVYAPGIWRSATVNESGEE